MNKIICLLLIAIPLILLFLCNKSLIKDKCKYDLKCVANEISILKTPMVKNNTKNNTSTSENNEEIVEGFFDGLTSFLSGSSPAPPSQVPGTIPPVISNRHYNIVDEKLPSPATPQLSSTIVPSSSQLSQQPLVSQKFPPEDLMTTNPIKDISGTVAPTKQIIQHGKQPIKEISATTKDNKLDNDIDVSNIKQDKRPARPSFDKMKCQFFNGKCPSGYNSMGDFSVEGVGSGMILNCGNAENSEIKMAKAVAKIKDNSINEIIVIDEGIGFDVENPPKITIEGGKGNGATAEAIIDDEGKLKIIKVIKPGYNYSETPQVIIENPNKNQSCHLCCRF